MYQNCKSQHYYNFWTTKYWIRTLFYSFPSKEQNCVLPTMKKKHSLCFAPSPPVSIPTTLHLACVFRSLGLIIWIFTECQKSKTVYSLPWKKTFLMLCTQSPCVHSYHFAPGMCLSIIGPYYMNIHWMYCRMTKLKNVFGHINITVSKCFFNNNSFFLKKINNCISHVSTTTTVPYRKNPFSRKNAYLQTSADRLFLVD